MPVLFTLELPTDDEIEARRLASLIATLPCDLHGDVPTRVRLTERTRDVRSVYVTGCCPQLYLVVTDRLVQEAGPSDGGAYRGDPEARDRKSRRRPSAV